MLSSSPILRRLKSRSRSRGAVQTPGVYRLSQDARLDELLIAAGGANADADLAPHNLARRLNDAEVVVIERISPATPVIAEATQTVPNRSTTGSTSTRRQTRNSRPCRVSALYSPSALSMIALPMGRIAISPTWRGSGHLGHLDRRDSRANYRRPVIAALSGRQSLLDSPSDGASFRSWWRPRSFVALPAVLAGQLECL